MYVPLEMREAKPEKAKKLDKIGIIGDLSDDKMKTLRALEEGRIVCRDIGGSDPERMAAPRLVL